MHLDDYLAREGDADPARRNPGVTCNALSKTKTSFNCNLTPSQAITLARHLLHKAQVILDESLEDAVVQLWNVGPDSERLSCGLTRVRKGARRKKKSVAPDAAGDAAQSVPQADTPLAELDAATDPAGTASLRGS